ncbi:hypothetical protein NB636_02030 [Oxalobacter aliiformigenes]|uniref:hypothetical protein n=1 Tax=Oxalobacter aliiformigenes TaxID=2946593 RepID=UPI0022AE72E9|nr:hypothetical protein [Oxalobacter aliiformigenes]MCZ4065459.1 hypothetical protein [Oxalobacter aliiformigenes]WAV99666.1 hypothetical protein NB636_02030 [Oxalobacter aliiformigenes]
MFGIDDLAIAGLIASLAGTAISYNSQQQAAKRANQASLDAMRRQQQYQQQAEQTALERANDYKTENRQEKQEAIRQELEQEYSAPALAAQEINANAATTQGDVSNDYKTYKAASDANVEDLTRTFANLMARTNAAKQLRLNEGYKNADAASTIGRLQNFAQGQSVVDQMKIQDAANSGAGMSALGGLVSSLGTAAMSGAFNGLLDKTPSVAEMAGLKSTFDGVKLPGLSQTRLPGVSSGNFRLPTIGG